LGDGLLSATVAAAAARIDGRRYDSHNLCPDTLAVVVVPAAAAAASDVAFDDNGGVVVFVFAVDLQDNCNSNHYNTHTTLLQRARAQTSAGREGGGGPEGDTPRMARALNACFCNDCFQLDCVVVRVLILWRVCRI